MGAIRRIDAVVNESPLVIFIKGSPKRPNCSSSARAVDLMQRCRARFHSIDVQKDPELRAFLPKYSSWDTFPQLYVLGEFVGGSDVMSELYEKGELQKICQEVGASEALAS